MANPAKAPNAERIEAVFFDVGGTLETLVQTDALRLQACEHMLSVLNDAGAKLALAPATLREIVLDGLARYAADRELTQREQVPARVWRQYVFADVPGIDDPLDRVLDALAEELASIWDTEAYQRLLRPEVPEALAGLKNLGLRLGIISNVFSVHQVPYDLARFGIRHYFDTIVLSTAYGHRKPARSIFEHAAGRVSALPAACAHVGDSLWHDVAGAQRAGYGRGVLLDAPLTEPATVDAPGVIPDAVVHDLRDLIPLLAGG